MKAGDEFREDKFYLCNRILEDEEVSERFFLKHSSSNYTRGWAWHRC